MKRKSIGLLFGILLAAAALSGCTKESGTKSMESNDVESSNVETAESSSPEAVESITSTPAANPTEPATEEKNEKRSDYENLIAAAKACITENAGQIPEGYDFSVGILTSRGLGTLGYLIEDIDGNGTGITSVKTA